mgnify:CR=1 FL=1
MFESSIIFTGTWNPLKSDTWFIEAKLIWPSIKSFLCWNKFFLNFGDKCFTKMINEPSLYIIDKGVQNGVPSYFT